MTRGIVCQASTETRCRLQQHGRFANARVATNENQRTADHSPTQHPVEFTNAGFQALFAATSNLGEGDGGLRLRGRQRPGSPRDLLQLLDKGIPRLAIRTTSEPFAGVMATGLADKDVVGLRHTDPYAGRCTLMYRRPN